MTTDIQQARERLRDMVDRKRGYGREKWQRTADIRLLLDALDAKQADNPNNPSWERRYKSLLAATPVPVSPTREPGEHKHKCKLDHSHYGRGEPCVCECGATMAVGGEWSPSVCATCDGDGEAEVVNVGARSVTLVPCPICRPPDEPSVDAIDWEAADRASKETWGFPEAANLARAYAALSPSSPPDEPSVRLDAVNPSTHCPTCRREWHDEPSVARARFEKAVRELSGEDYSEVMSLYDEAASRSPAPPEHCNLFPECAPDCDQQHDLATPPTYTRSDLEAVAAFALDEAGEGNLDPAEVVTRYLQTRAEK